MAGYEEAIEELRARGVEVVAASVDPRDDAATTVEKLSLSYPVLWGLDADDVAERFGAYVHDDAYLQPLNVLLRDGEVHQATYSSGPLGRLQPEEVIQWVDYMEEE